MRNLIVEESPDNSRIISDLQRRLSYFWRVSGLWRKLSGMFCKFLKSEETFFVFLVHTDCVAWIRTKRVPKMVLPSLEKVFESCLLVRIVSVTGGLFVPKQNFALSLNLIIQT
jgi:hypothetical protein